MKLIINTYVIALLLFSHTASADIMIDLHDPRRSTIDGGPGSNGPGP